MDPAKADVPPPYNQPAGAYPQQPAGAYPQQPVGEYQQQPVGAYPAPQPTGGYQQPAVAYAPQAGQPQFVVSQQPVVTAVVGGPQPPDYMVSSILVCLFCFWPTGIFAIYYSSRRNNLLASGDVSGANRMANSAKNLMIASIVVGVVWIVLVIIWSILRGVALAATVTYSRHGY